MRVVIVFLIRKSRPRLDGKAPVYLRFTMDGRRVELSTGIFASKEEWDEVGQKFRGNTSSAQVINAKLNKIRTEIYDIYNQLKSGGDEFDVVSIKNKFLKIDLKKDVGILEVFDYYLETMLAKLQRGYSIETYKHYKSSRNRVAEFIKYRIKKKDYSLDKIDYKFLEAFDQYLKKKYNVQQNTAWNYHKHFRRILNLAISLDYIEKNPYGKYKVALEPTHREFLTPDELDRIEKKLIRIERLKIVRDLFVFSCYTGLSYADIIKLSKSHLQTGTDGKEWIVIDRSKTNTRCRIPILMKAAEILKIYEDYPTVYDTSRVLPRLTNQKLNSYLKELGDMCKIRKSITMHMARHTFATTVTLSNGVPIETVSKILGHTSLKTTQIYAKIVDQKISEDMDNLQLRLAEKKQKSNGV